MQNLGLYVYGSLLMAMAYVVGIVNHNQNVMIAALVAASAAALAEALSGVVREVYGEAHYAPVGILLLVNGIAIGSWFGTAFAVLYAVYSI